jgi:hypothetical protein
MFGIISIICCMFSITVTGFLMVPYWDPLLTVVPEHGLSSWRATSDRNICRLGMPNSSVP